MVHLCRHRDEEDPSAVRCTAVCHPPFPAHHRARAYSDARIDAYNILPSEVGPIVDKVRVSRIELGAALRWEPETKSVGES